MVSLDLEEYLFQASWGIATINSIVEMQVCTPTNNEWVLFLLHNLTIMNCNLFYWFLLLNYFPSFYPKCSLLQSPWPEFFPCSPFPFTSERVLPLRGDNLHSLDNQVSTATTSPTGAKQGSPLLLWGSCISTGLDFKCDTFCMRFDVLCRWYNDMRSSSSWIKWAATLEVQTFSRLLI